MKRSEVNKIIKDAEEFFASKQFHLPPWAFWTPEQWKGRGETEVVRNKLGWDITDFGKGRFEKDGLLLFTVRNGNLAAGDKKPYAEKIMIVREGQVTPMHFHWSKMEDIINRGGGNLLIDLFDSTDDEELSKAEVTVMVDGLARTVPAGGTLTLAPGESISLEQGVYHSFYGEEGKGWVLVGEVSAVNDDDKDNRFHEPQPRFPAIEEDEPPYRLLVNDYEDYV